jgi:hypothetical protein
MRGGRASTKTDPNAPFYVMLRDAERKILKDALEYHDYNQSAAAKMLGVSHTIIWRRVLILGGVMPDSPRREPFEYQPSSKGNRAKPDHQHSAAGVAHSSESETTASSNGAADGVHDEQDRTEGQPDVEG